MGDRGHVSEHRTTLPFEKQYEFENVLKITNRSFGLLKCLVPSESPTLKLFNACSSHKDTLCSTGLVSDVYR